MNTKILLCSVIVAAFAAPALADDTTKTDTTKTDTTKTDTSAGLTDVELATLAHHRHLQLMEIDMGKAAMKQSKNKQVRAFGKTLVADHGKTLKKVDAFVKANKVTLPDDKPADEAEAKEMAATMEKMEQIKAMSGEEFDRAFLPAMADGHTKELAKLEAALPSITNAKLKAMLEKSLTSMAKHASIAKKLDTSVQQTASASGTTTPPASTTKDTPKDTKTTTPQ